MVVFLSLFTKTPGPPLNWNVKWPDFGEITTATTHTTLHWYESLFYINLLNHSICTSDLNMQLIAFSK
jgi:hypothetical protein